MKKLYIIIVTIYLFVISSCEEDKIIKVQIEEIEWIGSLNPNGSTVIFCLTSNEYGSLFFSEWGESLYKSTDDGLTWFESKYPPQEFNGAWLFGSKDKNLYFITNDNLYFSSDDGANWDLVRKRNNGDYFPMIISKGVVYTQALDSIQQKYKLLKSSDNCRTFEEIERTEEKTSINSITMGDDNNIFILTKNGKIYTTDLDNLNWKMLKSDLKFKNSQIEFVNGFIFIYSEDGVFEKIGVNGKGNDINNLNSTNIIDFVFTTNNNIYIANYDGILKSSDLGNTWKIIRNNSLIYNLILSKNDYLFVTYEREIYRSKNKVE